MAEIDKIKDRIKKLFALSKSSNANEAALALGMAQKLMDEFGVKRNEVGEFEILKESVRGNSGQHPTKYESHLIKSIADSFGCELAYGVVKKVPKAFYDFDYYEYEYGHIFVGMEHRVKIATFVSDVLLRKLKRARLEYVKTLNRVRIRGNKIKRADDFCLGWVYTVVSKLHEYTNTPDEQTAIDDFVANLDWADGLKTISRGGVGKSTGNDFGNGQRAAAGVQIQHGIEGYESGARLLGGAGRKET
jgi:hypothetical protein